MKRFAWIALLLTGGCATAPGAFTSEDFRWRVLELEQPPAQVVSAFYDGMRACPPNWGVPECSPARPDGSVTCELHVVSFQGRSNIMAGRAEFTPNGKGGTTARLGVRTWILHDKGLN